MHRVCTLTACAIALFAASAASAQTFDLSWYTIDGGGAMFSTGGSFELSGTIGQPDAGVMTGGNFELSGGFWAGASTSGCSGFITCDANCDGSVDNGDIDAFVTALLSQAVYQTNYPSCNFMCNNDTNHDGSVNNADIDNFVTCLLGG